MEESNKFETKIDGSGSGSMLYDAKTQPQKESGHSSVYGTEPGLQVADEAVQPVELSKSSEPEAQPESMAPVELSKSPESEAQPQGMAPVQLAKPSDVASQTVSAQHTVPPQPGFYGQPVNGNDMNFNSQPANGNLMGGGPMQISPPIQGAPAEKQKKNHANLIVGILCAAAVVIFVAIGVLVTKSLFGGDDARTQLAKGMANMAKEMAAYQSLVVEDIGFAELGQLKAKKPIRTNIDLSFTDPNATGSFSSIDMELDGVTDYKNKMAEYDVSLGTYGIDMNIGTIVVANNTLYVSVPIVFHEEVYSLDLTNLGRDFNDSAWSSLMDVTLPENYSLILFQDSKTADSNKQSGAVSGLRKIFGNQGKIDADSMKVETIKQKREFSFDGTFAEYGGVRVTMDKDIYNESMEAMKNGILESDYYAEFMKGFQTTYTGDFDEFKENMDYFIEILYGIRYEQDIVIDFYLDKKGRIVNISTPEDIAVSSQYMDVKSMAVDIDFSGRERALDSIEGGMYVQTGDEILYLGISREANITEDFYSEDLTLRLQDNNSADDITFWYANQWGSEDHTFDMQMEMKMLGDSFELRADGAFSDIVKGEGYTFRINHSSISSNGKDLLLMAGSIETGLTDNDIEVPENATKILEMSAGEIMSLFYGTLY